ncbi:hypothetical protein H7F51_04610 [Novosphingobium flavum]|uniref:DUF4261 domain-containing protein n=1 Tax=Novosphingobium flavum TaxID=1778672 RepID=A0A7X1KKQ5_9SPHN|nr:hypothetical protein [Novosphingobium flavum]MBC2664796.1 hypothetical protein [Novosphingobium flavum]
MMVDDSAGRRQAGISLLFARGTRPDADAIAALAAAAGETVGFSISHRPTEHPYWLELLALGLTFDIQGLAPGIPADTARPLHAFALPLDETRGYEALTVRPGPHLSAGATLLPVVRALSALGCELAGLPGLAAIGWEPARTVMAPDYYRRVVSAWLKGGAFPGLGMTALVRGKDGTVGTDGLTFFIGQEMQIDPLIGESPADTAKFALRVIHDLVENGPYSPGSVEGPGGASLNCELMANGNVLRIRRAGEAET